MYTNCYLGPGCLAVILAFIQGWPVPLYIHANTACKDGGHTRYREMLRRCVPSYRRYFSWSTRKPPWSTLASPSVWEKRDVVPYSYLPPSHPSGSSKSCRVSVYTETCYCNTILLILSIPCIQYEYLKLLHTLYNDVHAGNSGGQYVSAEQLVQEYMERVSYSTTHAVSNRSIRSSISVTCILTSNNSDFSS